MIVDKRKITFLLVWQHLRRSKQVNINKWNKIPLGTYDWENWILSSKQLICFVYHKVRRTTMKNKNDTAINSTIKTVFAMSIKLRVKKTLWNKNRISIKSIAISRRRQEKFMVYICVMVHSLCIGVPSTIQKTV